MLIKVFGAAVQGIDATLITIEVNSSRGCMFYLVGLPDSAVKESHQRIISALQVNGYRMPTSNIVINMAPADIRKRRRCLRPAVGYRHVRCQRSNQTGQVGAAIC